MYVIAVVKSIHLGTYSTVGYNTPQVNGVAPYILLSAIIGTYI